MMCSIDQHAACPQFVGNFSQVLAICWPPITRCHNSPQSDQYHLLYHLPFSLFTFSLAFPLVLSTVQQSFWPNNPNEDVKPYNISLNNGAIPFYSNGNGVENGVSVANQNNHLTANGMCSPLSVRAN